MNKANRPAPAPFRFIDLFCGIGGFRIAAGQASKELGLPTECVFSSDIDHDAQKTYEANFGERPHGDITRIDASDIPDHDILFGGFPCQAFSIIGEMKGFADTRGTLFFDIARILEEKRPRALVLENVKQLRGHDKGKTLETILNVLDELGYWIDYRILNALDFGLPQKRERIVIVGFQGDDYRRFSWPVPSPSTGLTLDDVLDDNDSVESFYFASPQIRKQRKAATKGKKLPKGRSIWHENKSGNVSALPYSCALRAGASYNYLLVDGVRRLTMREMLRLQGFPDHFKIACGYSATRKQAGNSVPVPMIEAVIREVLSALSGASQPVNETPSKIQPQLFSELQ